MVGRKRELQILDTAYTSSHSELLAIYGRRRVGKTYMIREHFGEKIFFKFSGLYQGTNEENLSEFSKALELLNKSNIVLKPADNWFEAFANLRALIEGDKSKKKKVVFLDELPWMALPKSRFLTAFESFWNGWASGTKNLLVVLCGSASAWMINKIEKNKGGLYNRVTRRILLKPFTLAETEDFFKAKQIYLSRFHIVELYMAFGGIPHYLNQVEKGETPAVAINRIMFEDNGLLKDEYDQLFESLFGVGNIHQKIVETLATKRYGLPREAILEAIKMTSGGWFSETLHELESSGFIAKEVPHGNKKKDAHYKLSDNYCLFYLYFKKRKNAKNWAAVYNTGAWHAWCGLSFENVVHYHAQNIVKSLGLTGIYTEISTWRHKGTDEMPGTQIDLLISRADKAFNICEIKFSENPLVISKTLAQELKTKKSAFQFFTKTRASLFTTLISFAGIVPNEISQEAIDHVFGIDDFWG